MVKNTMFQKKFNPIPVFIVVHLAALAAAWVAYTLVVKSHPEQMLGRGEYLQLVPVDAAMLAQVERVKKSKAP